MTENLILYELQKIHEALTKTTEEHTINLRMIISTEISNFSEPILYAIRLGLIRLSVYNSVFNVNRRNNQFLHEGCSSNISKNLTSYSTVIPGAHEISEITELIKEETKGNVII